MNKKLIKIKVIAAAKQNKIGEVMQDANGEDILKIYTTAIRENGKANDAVKELLAKEYKIKKSGITILKGSTAQIKIVEVEC